MDHVPRHDPPLHILVGHLFSRRGNKILVITSQAAKHQLLNVLRPDMIVKILFPSAVTPHRPLLANLISLLFIQVFLVPGHFLYT